MAAPIKCCWWVEWRPGLALAPISIIKRIDVPCTFLPLSQCRAWFALPLNLFLLYNECLSTVTRLLSLIIFSFSFLTTSCLCLNSFWLASMLFLSLKQPVLNFQDRQKAGSLQASSFSIIDFLNCLRKTRKFLPCSPLSDSQWANLWG